jgi:hypothetical protein
MGVPDPKGLSDIGVDSRETGHLNYRPSARLRKHVRAAMACEYTNS